MRIAHLFVIATLGSAACSSGGFSESDDRLFAPPTDPRGEAVDGLTVGHRLLDANEPELALEAYQRAAATEGLTGEVLSAIGSANLALGRLNQAEGQLRRAVETDAANPRVWNNLGVVLIERGKVAEAAEIFRRAYALDNGESDAIRDNLRLALAKRDNSGYRPIEADEFRLVRRGMGEYLIRNAE
ncbi:Tetratricopeptide repeat protein [Roseivivax jejudonensis]|uniref:Tetratricopeptide repeat protein n=1 Tax=Roseivivax jejudonensis TaxID=1529041 RepID=A0A1X7A7U1_9RHOB|nr:tetratricopeptide repeat protein [Roseivivax jejudonensis]SLN72386.1 Tetratricopeptide repeat protein [Roseivivax jejudonensis]